jgi:FkbM family methyltransferase
MVDPTPRAVAHFRSIEGQLGSPAASDYMAGGTQPITSYDLSSLRPGQLRLLEAAIAADEGQARFYQPPNTDHVSYSLVNFQNEYSTSTPYIEVRTVRMQSVISTAATMPAVVKLDIEGVAGPVIDDMIESGILPMQVCVEFDELQTGSAEAWGTFGRAHDRLRAARYRLAHYDGKAGFLYLLPEVYAAA